MFGATAIPASTAATATPKGAASSLPVADGGPLSQSPSSPAVSPPPRPAAFGGNATGRPRQDGFAPGSEEAKAADREKERLKKQRQRAKARALNPPVLPSRVAPPAPPVAGQTQAPVAPQIVGAVSPSAPAVDFIAWTPDDFKEIVAELVPTVEQQRVKKLTEKAAKAKLPAELLREVEKDSRWDETTKKTLNLCVPPLAAKYANMSGVSATWKHEGIFALCLIRIMRKDAALHEKLDKLILQNAELLKKSGSEPK